MGGMYKALKPLANAYAQITGHRQHGLRYDDLIIEEREDVTKVSYISFLCDPCQSRGSSLPRDNPARNGRADQYLRLSNVCLSENRTIGYSG